MSVQKRRLKKNGYVAILLAFATPAIIYGVKYAIDKSIFSSWNIFKKQNNEVYKKCATAIAYEVASHWNPVLTLEQQIDSLQKIADETYNTYPEYHGGILGRAIAGLERIDIFDLKSLKVTQRTSMNSKFRYIKYKNADVSYYPYTLTINNNANPYFALYRFVDSVTNEITDNTNKNHKRPLVAMWAYERKNRLPRNILSEADIFIGPASFPKMSDKDKNNKYGPYSSLSNEGAFVFTNALPDDINFKNSRYSTSGSQAYFLSENNFDTKFATTKNNFSKIGISSISKGSAISDKLMIPDTVSADDPKVTITLEGKDKIKIEADATDSSDPSKKYKDKDTAYATPAKCKVDIILSIPTNEAACNTGNLDAASITSGSIQTSQVDANKNTADAKLTPIYQIAQAYRTFLKENFFFVQGVNVGLIPYSGKVSLPPNRENWTTSFNAFYSNAFIDDISKFPRKCKPSFRMSILYGTSGLAGAKLYGSTAAADKQLSTASYTWGTTLTGFPIMFRMGLQSLERDTTKQDLLGNKISYGGNYIYTGSILSSENPEKSATKRSYTATMNEPAEPPSALANKFLKMNMNPCYGGYANLLGMKCEQDSPFFLPNPYYIIELTPNVQRIYEILGSLYPFYDTKNVSNFTFIPITWANNLLAEWTDGSTDIAGDTKRISQEKKTSSGRKKVLIFVVNKPDYFEPGELTYLGFNNDYAEFSGVESDKIDFTIPYNSSLYYGDDKQYTGTITGYKRILRFTGTAAKGNGTAATGNFYFPEKALLKIIVESTMQETSPNTIVTCNGIQHQIVGRKTIYVESNTIIKKSGNEWDVAISCGAYVKLISGELTNAIQPPRLEWKSGTNIIHSYNGKVPFTMTVQAPTASINFTPSSSNGANDYCGLQKIPYGKPQVFKFKSKQTNPDSPVGNKQIYNKFSYSLSNTSMSYTVSNRTIRWKGGSKGWSDEGLGVKYPTHSDTKNADYLNIRTDSMFIQDNVPCWKLVVNTHWEEDTHRFLWWKWHDKCCKTYKYYEYEQSTTQMSVRKYQQGKITFLLPNAINGTLSVRCSADQGGILAYNYDTNEVTIPDKNKGAYDISSSQMNMNISLASQKLVNIYQSGDIFSPKSLNSTLPSKPSAPGIKFYYMAPWLTWLPPAYALAAYLFGVEGLINAIVLGVNYLEILLKINKLPENYNMYRTGHKIYGAIFSINGNISGKSVKDDLVSFYGTGDIDVTVETSKDKTPAFSLTKKTGEQEIQSFDITSWTPKEKDGENFFIRKIYVSPKNYDFCQQGDGGNRFDINIGLIHGATIVSVEPDYENVDMCEEENVQPKQTVKWNGGNIIETIGGQTPIKITVSPKEECKATFLIPNNTNNDHTNTTYSIPYKDTIKVKDIIKSDNIQLKADSPSSGGEKIKKFSYNLQNATMKCIVANRKIRWKGGDNEWSDEGVSISDSAYITKGLIKVDTEGNTTQSNNTRQDTDEHSHRIFTKRIDENNNEFHHIRSRIVWRFPEKITGSAKVCWRRNQSFFPTSEQLEFEEKIKKKSDELGQEADENDVNVTVKIESDKTNDPEIKFVEKRESVDISNKIDTRTIYGRRNIAQKYIKFCTDKIDECYEALALSDNSDNKEYKKYVDEAKSILNKIENRLSAINQEALQSLNSNANSSNAENITPPTNENETNNVTDTELKKLYQQLDEQLNNINKADTIKNREEFCCYIQTKKDKLQDFYSAKREIDIILNELKNLRNNQDYFNSQTGYYEPASGGDIDTEKIYFPYRKENTSGIKNPADNKTYSHLDGDGQLSYLTLLTTDNAKGTEYDSITTNVTNNEKKYWGIENNSVSSTSLNDLNSPSGYDYQYDNISLTNDDMLAIFQKTSYLSGHRFYYIEFAESNDFEISYDVQLPNTNKKPDKKEEDWIINEYEGTDIYTKKATNNTSDIINIAIIDPTKDITKNEITDTLSNVTTYTISGTVGFCGTGDISITATGADKPYAFIKSADNVSGVTEKFEFDTYHEIDEYGKPFKIYEVDSQGKITDKIATDENGNVKYKVAEKAIYIDPYTYKYEPIEGKPNTYQIKIELSNAVINTVEIMSDELAHPELSAHTRMVDGTTGTVPWSGGSDDTKHLDNLKIEGDAYQKLTNRATLVNTKDRAGTKMYVLNYPGDANLLIEDTGTFIGSDNTNIGKQTFIGGMINYETYAPGAIRKFFPFWRDSKYNNYITTSSTSASTNLTMCEFSYPMNAILLFGQQSLSLGDGSFYKYKWQDPATAKTDSRDVYDQANALKYVVRDACTKLKDDYGGDSNVRIYVIKYRAQKQYYSVPYYGNNQRTFNHDYSEIENCASPSTFLGMHLGGRYIYNADSEANLKKALNEIAEDIKEFAKYEDAKCVD